MKHNKWKQLQGFLINFATSGKYTEKNDFGMSDYLIRYVLLNFISVFGGAILIGFIVIRGMEGKWSTVAACSVMLLMAVLTIVFSRMKNVSQIVPGLMLMSFYGLLCIAVTYLGEARGMNFMFIFMYPLTTIMLLGMKLGIIFSATVLIIIVLQMTFSALSRFDYAPTISIHLLVTYALVFSVMIVIEKTRQTKDRLIDIQNVKLQELKEEAEAVSRIKSSFLANMSHEIRTPMNAISGMAELLLRRELAEDARAEVQDIKQASANLISIINDILDFSKIEAGKLEIIPVKYTLSSLINDTVNIIRIRLMEKPVRFFTNIDSNIPNNLFGDVARLRQIILNLLSNAAKFTEEGHVSLTITVDKREYKEHPLDNRVWLKIIISDTGIGIKPEDQDKLFSDFIQVDTKKNHSVEGTGLGLAITKRLCIAMAGDISIKSEYGKGSEFIVIIPQDLDMDEPVSVFGDLDFNEDNFYSSVSGSANRFIIPNARILVVDDLPTNLKVAEGLLASYKAMVETCLNGSLAIELIKQRHSEQQGFDMVFLDHMMPEMDGIEAANKIRAWEKEQLEQPEGVPIIALTANAVSGMREMFLEKGFNDFLAKPIDVSKLDDILDRWISKELKVESGGRGKSGELRVDKKLVLLVDKSPANLRLGMSTLEDKYDIITAPSIEKMAKLLETNSPALVLMSTNVQGQLPDVGKGIQVIRIDEPFHSTTLAACAENFFKGGSNVSI